MPWKIKDTMSMRLEFVTKALSGQFKIASLCREYNISRKSAYKWIERFKEEGIEGLVDRSKRPNSRPNITEEDQIELILKTKNQYPAWGGRKLRQYLLNIGYKDIVCESTFNRILKRNERIDPLESEKREHFIRFEKEKPNEMWQMDFKGHFKLGSGKCHPLTVLDDYSRFSIILKACEREDTKSVQQALESAFQEYGLPESMKMDNGSPWKGNYPFNLSRLTVWLMRLGICISHSRPRHPQTQGKLERFHRTLKEEVLRFHQFQTIEEAQIYFDEWRNEYNMKA